MTPAEEIRRLDARLERIQAAAEPVREYFAKYGDPNGAAYCAGLGPLASALLAAIDGKPPEDSLSALRSHKWIGCQRGGNPAESGSYEYVRYCSVCGMEDTCEDPLPPCPGVVIDGKPEEGR